MIDKAIEPHMADLRNVHNQEGARTAGFIGFHLAELLLREGLTVHGFDGMTDYYDVTLKQRRHAMLRQHMCFKATEAMLEDDAALKAAVDACAPDVIVHLAAQAGVRYSLETSAPLSTPMSSAPST